MKGISNSIPLNERIRLTFESIKKPSKQAGFGNPQKFLSEMAGFLRKKTQKMEEDSEIGDQELRIAKKVEWYPDRKLVVINLNGTLLHAANESIAPHYKKTTFKSHGEKVSYFIAKRPGAEKLLEELAKKFNVCIFTSYRREYAYAMIKFLNAWGYIQKVCHRDHCKLSTEGVFIKDLSVLGKKLKDIILIDDSDSDYEKPLNCFKVSTYRGQQDDDELVKLISPVSKLSEGNSPLLTSSPLIASSYTRDISRTTLNNTHTKNNGSDFLDDDDDLKEHASKKRLSKRSKSIFNKGNGDSPQIQRKTTVDQEEIDEKSEEKKMPVLNCKMFLAFHKRNPKSIVEVNKNF